MLDAGSKLASRIAPKEQAFHWILHRWLEEVYHAVPGQSSEVGFDDRKPFITSFFVVTSSILRLTKSLAGTCYGMSMYVACFLAVSYQPPHIAKHLAAFQMSWVSKWKVDEAKQSSPAGTMVSSALHGLQHENMSLTRTDTTQHPHPNYRWHHIGIRLPPVWFLILSSTLASGWTFCSYKALTLANIPCLPCPPLTPITKAHWVLLVVRLQQFNGFVSNICIRRMPQRIQRTWLRTPGDVQHLLISTLEPVARSIQKSYFDGKLGKWWKMNKCMDHGKTQTSKCFKNVQKFKKTK